MKTVAALSLLLLFGGVAIADEPNRGGLISQEVRGGLRYCYYSSGAVITVRATDWCPR